MDFRNLHVVVRCYNQNGPEGRVMEFRIIIRG